MLIYVLSASGKPLMPTKRTGHIKRLLNCGRARIVTKVPFTVQLKYETDDLTQRMCCGTDPGRTNIGEAVIDENGRVPYKAHITSRNREVTELVSGTKAGKVGRKQRRQMSRRGERLRKKRRAKKYGTTTTFPNGRMLPGYEKPVILKDIINTEAKFSNRKRPKGWLTPSARQLVETHLNAARSIVKILPVTDWALEYNRFAFMLLEDGSVRGVDFQNGRLKNFRDVEDYIWHLQDGKCACCGKLIQHYHHIHGRGSGGSERPENRIGLCYDCHDKVHKGELSLEVIGEKKKYAALSVLNQAMPYIAEGLTQMFGEEHVHFCAGYETSRARESLGLDKDHSEDALCIAMLGAGLTEFKGDPETFEIRQFRKHDRARIKAQKERTYYLDGKAVCKNRHKRTGQDKTDSLEEFRKKHPSDVGRLTVKKSKRSYNRLGRELPGAEVVYRGKRYIVSGNHNDSVYT